MIARTKSAAPPARYVQADVPGDRGELLRAVAQLLVEVSQGRTEHEAADDPSMEDPAWPWH